MQQDNVEDKQNGNKKDGDKSLFDLNSKTWGSCYGHQEVEKSTVSGVENNGGEGLLTIGLGHGKLKARRTGFKPYKRCSVEAKENRILNGNQAEEKCPKRIRVEGATT